MLSLNYTLGMAQLLLDELLELAIKRLGSETDKTELLINKLGSSSKFILH